MARQQDKDLWPYHKIDTQFNDHYLNTAYNNLLDFIEKKNGTEEIVLSNLMSCVNSTVKEVKDKKDEIKKLNKYVEYLQKEIKELLNK